MWRNLICEKISYKWPFKVNVVYSTQKPYSYFSWLCANLWKIPHVNKDYWLFGQSLFFFFTITSVIVWYKKIAKNRHSRLLTRTHKPTNWTMIEEVLVQVYNGIVCIFNVIIKTWQRNENIRTNPWYINSEFEKRPYKFVFTQTHRETNSISIRSHRIGGVSVIILETIWNI